MSGDLLALARELSALDRAVGDVERESAGLLAGLPAVQRRSAVNLLHYLTLRRHDLRELQLQLAAQGLSSLGRTEGHVRASLHAILRAVHLLAGLDCTVSVDPSLVSFAEGGALLAEHTSGLFGPAPPTRGTRIMVTLPAQAADDYPLVRGLVESGMDCARINCAHDGPEQWSRMIAHVRRASTELERPCMVCMDLAGPKLRTGAIADGPAVQKLRPARDLFGRVIRPSLVCVRALGHSGEDGLASDTTITIDQPWTGDVPPGSEIELIDARERPRVLRVVAASGHAVLAALDRTAYVVPGTEVRLRRGEMVEHRRIATVPTQPQAIRLRAGDTLVLTRDSIQGEAAVVDHDGTVLSPAHIGVTLPQVFRDVAPGHAIWFDDGRIGGRITHVEFDCLAAEIVHAPPAGARLRSDKGINVPDTNLHFPALTHKDLEDLRFIVEHADIVGYSFVRTPADVEQLQTRMSALGGGHLGIVLKIETRRAFEELPRLLLACMRTGRFGVMIARGDLAIECGFERLAEIQEEILWIAEAAHTPVIWATQVLESMAKTGVPSRAEVTDAAMAERAECVMLNKGPFVRDSVRTLDDILRRMESHQTKKRAMLRRLNVAHLALVGSDGSE